MGNHRPGHRQGALAIARGCANVATGIDVESNHRSHAADVTEVEARMRAERKGNELIARESSRLDAQDLRNTIDAKIVATGMTATTKVTAHASGTFPAMDIEGIDHVPGPRTALDRGPLIPTEQSGNTHVEHDRAPQNVLLVLPSPNGPPQQPEESLRKRNAAPHNRPQTRTRSKQSWDLSHQT
jgi:hypothetical protein